MKKIVIIGPRNRAPGSYSYATSFIRPFQNLGFDVTFFNSRPQSSNKFMRSIEAQLINRMLQKNIAKINPDACLLIKTESLDLQTYKKIKSHTKKMIGYHPDNPFCLWNKNSSSSLISALPLFDCYWSWNKTISDNLIMCGAQHSCFMPFAYDENFIKTSEPTTASFDVSFIGSWEPKRELFMSGLIEKRPTLTIGIWGNGWEHAQPDILKNYIKGTAVYGAEAGAIIASSRINLNFLRTQNKDAHNMRTFEIPALGGFLLSEYSEQQAEEFFKEGLSIACFKNPYDLIEKIDFYLANQDKREAIMHAAKIAVSQYTLSKAIARVVGKCLSPENERLCEANHDDHTKTQDRDFVDQKSV